MTGKELKVFIKGKSNEPLSMEEQERLDILLDDMDGKENDRKVTK